MQNTNLDSYRQQFASAEESSSYDRKEYHPSSYSSLLWEIEREQVLELTDRWVPTLGKASYLDFACGTGRVLSFLEEHVASATGIEISEQMAQFALQKVRRAQVKCMDITMDPRGIDLHGRFQLITAFRFILNAEPALRDAVFAQLCKMLADEKSVIIVNNHGNVFSHKAALWPYHWLKMRQQAYHTSGNYMTHGEVAALASRHGLEIVDRVGCGFFSAKALKLLAYTRVLAAEQWVARTSLARFTVNQMYVLRRKPA